MEAGKWEIYGGYKFPKPDNWENLLLNRYENSIRGIMLRDRNHASIVMWGIA